MQVRYAYEILVLGFSVGWVAASHSVWTLFLGPNHVVSMDFQVSNANDIKQKSALAKYPRVSLGFSQPAGQ